MSRFNNPDEFISILQEFVENHNGRFPHRHEDYHGIKLGRRFLNYREDAVRGILNPDTFEKINTLFPDWVTSVQPNGMHRDFFDPNHVFFQELTIESNSSL